MSDKQIVERWNEAFENIGELGKLGYTEERGALWKTLHDRAKKTMMILDGMAKGLVSKPGKGRKAGKRKRNTK